MADDDGYEAEQTSSDAPLHVSVTESVADPDLADAYLAHMNAAAPPTILLLPTHNRGSWVYRESMAGSVKEARRHGVPAAFLLPSEERYFLHEYSAHFVLELAMAIPVEITTQVLIDAAKFIYIKLRSARANFAEAGGVSLTLKVEEVSKDPDGAVSIRNLDAQGPPDDVVRLILGMLNGGDAGVAIDQARREVDKSDGAGSV